MKGNENRRVAIRLGKTGIAEHAQAALKHASFESGIVEHLVKSELRRDHPLSPFTSFSALVKHVEELIRTVRDAFYRFIALHCDVNWYQWQILIKMELYF